MKKKQKTMEELVKDSVNLSDKRPTDKTATDKMIANLQSKAKKMDGTKVILTKPLKDETKEQLKARLKKTMGLHPRGESEKENRFGMNDEDITIENKK